MSPDQINRIEAIITKSIAEVFSVIREECGAEESVASSGDKANETKSYSQKEIGSIAKVNRNYIKPALTDSQFPVRLRLKQVNNKWVGTGQDIRSWANEINNNKELVKEYLTTHQQSKAEKSGWIPMDWVTVDSAIKDGDDNHA